MNQNIQLVIRQQPKYGRRIGFSDTPTFLYPELVLELRNVQKGVFVCHVVIVSLDVDDQSTLLRPDRANKSFDSNVYQNLTGTKIQPSEWCRDPVDGELKCFFVFADLGIRTLGEFRLLCHVVDPEHHQTIQTITESIFVGNPKECPGVGAPTVLVKSLSIQGLSKSGRRYKDLLH